MSDEIDMLARQRTKLDEKVLSLLDHIEGVRSSEAARKQTLAQAAVALKSIQAAYTAKADALKADAKKLLTQRKAAAKGVDPSLIERYDHLRSLKNGLAIVVLEDANACGGCKMGLPSSIVKRVLSGDDIETCNNCKRILIVKP